MLSEEKRERVKVVETTDALNASVFTIRKARAKKTIERSQQQMTARKAFRPLGFRESEGAVKDRKNAMKRCWLSVEKKFDEVLQNANSEAVRVSNSLF